MRQPGRLGLPAAISIDVNGMVSFKYSLQWLFVATTFCMFSLAAMVYATMLWASICFTLAIMVFFVSTLGVILERGPPRAFWCGFTFLGCGYLALVYTPGFDRVVGQRLASTKVFGYLEPAIRQTESELRGAFRDSPANVAISPMHEAVLTYTSAGNQLPPQWGHFQEAGHSMLSLLLGYAGGLLGRVFWIRGAGTQTTTMG